MNSKKKNVFKVIAAALVICSVLCHSTGVFAAEDVTSKMKQDKGIKAICKMVNFCMAVESPTKDITFDLTDNTQVRIIGEAVSGMQDPKVMDFDAGMDNGYVVLKKSKYEKLCKNMFGKIPDLSKFKDSDYVKKKNGKVYVSVGDWGGSYPAYKTLSVSKVSSTKYIIKIKNIMEVEEYMGDDWSYGTTTITVVKSKKSSYGYVIKGLKFSK